MNFRLLKTLFMISMVIGIFTSCDRENRGCTNPEAANFDPFATEDDGSCYTATNSDGECACPYPKGTLKVSNSSDFTIQRVRLGDRTLGNLEPGDIGEWTIEPGFYWLFIEDAYGSEGCDPIEFRILEGETVATECNL
jgi:hypothetical protein